MQLYEMEVTQAMAVAKQTHPKGGESTLALDAIIKPVEGEFWFGLFTDGIPSRVI